MHVISLGVFRLLEECTSTMVREENMSTSPVTTSTGASQSIMEVRKFILHQVSICSIISNMSQSDLVYTWAFPRESVGIASVDFSRTLALLVWSKRANMMLWIWYLHFSEQWLIYAVVFVMPLVHCATCDSLEYSISDSGMTFAFYGQKLTLRNWWTWCDLRSCAMKHLLHITRQG